MSNEKLEEAFVEFLKHGPNRIEDILEPWDYWHLLKKPRPRRARRMPSPASIIAKAKAMGVDVVVGSDGSMTLKCGTAAPAPAGRAEPEFNGKGGNSWDDLVTETRQ
jgi:hypothetical protein